MKVNYVAWSCIMGNDRENRRQWKVVTEEWLDTERQAFQ